MTSASQRMRWAGTVAALAVVNMGVGLLAQRWLASRLGTSSTADAFQTGVALPTTIATAFMAGIPTALVPTFVARREARQSLLSRNEALGLFVFALALMIAVMASAGWFAEVLGSADRASIANFLRISALLFPVVAAAAVAQANLHAQNRYGLSGSSGVANGVGLLLSFVVIGRSAPTIQDLAVCVVCGYLAQVLWVAVGFRGLRGGQRPAAAAALLPVLFLIGSYLVVRLQPVVERSLAVGLGTGSAATLGYAGKVQLGLTLVAGFGVSVVALPAASVHVAAGAFSKVARTLDEAFQLTAVAVVIACAAGWALAVPIVQTVLATGAFPDSDIVPTAHVIRAGLLVVAGGALSGPLVAILYACQARRRVVASGVAALMVGLLASLVLRRSFGVNGIVLGSGLGSCAAFVVQFLSVRRVLHGWSPVAALWRVRAPFACLTATALAFAVIVGRLAGAPMKSPSLLVLVVLGVSFVTLCAPSALWVVVRVRSADRKFAEADAGVPS